MELISIIVPVYQVEKFIARCIESLVNQTYKNIEIILVDDGTKDLSGLICDEWGDMDIRIHVIHKENGGLSDARNAGIDYAHGKYIVFVDSDDYVSANMCEALYAEIKQTNVDIVVGNHGDVDEEGNAISRGLFARYEIDYDRIYWGEEYLRGIMHNSLPTTAWGKMYSKAFISTHRFRKGVLSEDYIFFLENVVPETTISFIDREVYYYTKRSNSITAGFNEAFYYDKIKFIFDIEVHLTDKFPDIKGVVKSTQLKLLAWYLTQVPYKYVKDETEAYTYIYNQLKDNRALIVQSENSIFVKGFLLLFLCSKRIAKIITAIINFILKKYSQ